MRSFVVIVCLLITVSTLDAQHRGGGPGVHHSGTVSAPSVAAAPVVRAAPPVFAGRPAPIARPQVPVIVQRPYVRPSRTIVVPPVIGYYPSYFSPFSPILPAYAAPVYPDVYVSAAPQPVPVNPNEIQLSYQVQQLSQEVEQLRAEQAIRTAVPQPVPQYVPDRAPILTVLIFRDGHRIEIQNYAIVGSTIWVFDERTSTKISTLDLDLEATQKENRSRGIRFSLPEK